MPQPKKYSSAAEKQQAYRDRQLAAKVTKKPPRVKTRPARLAAVEDELRSLAEGYRDWLEAMPTNQAETQLAEDLKEISEKLDAMADEVNSLEPPRGFGR